MGERVDDAVARQMGRAVIEQWPTLLVAGESPGYVCRRCGNRARYNPTDRAEWGCAFCGFATHAVYLHFKPAEKIDARRERAKPTITAVHVSEGTLSLEGCTHRERSEFVGELGVTVWICDDCWQQCGVGERVSVSNRRERLRQLAELLGVEDWPARAAFAVQAAKDQELERLREAFRRIAPMAETHSDAQLSEWRDAVVARAAAAGMPQGEGLCDWFERLAREQWSEATAQAVKERDEPVDGLTTAADQAREQRERADGLEAELALLRAQKLGLVGERDSAWRLVGQWRDTACRQEEALRKVLRAARDGLPQVVVGESSPGVNPDKRLGVLGPREDGP